MKMSAIQEEANSWLLSLYISWYASLNYIFRSFYYPQLFLIYSNLNEPFIIIVLIEEICQKNPSQALSSRLGKC